MGLEVVVSPNESVLIKFCSLFTKMTKNLLTFLFENLRKSRVNPGLHLVGHTKNDKVSSTTVL